MEETVESASSASGSNEFDSTESHVDGIVFKYSKESTDAVTSKPIGKGVKADSETYNMDHERRGVALIFNHVNFVDMETRKGTVKDCKNISDLFRSLGFVVRVYTDLEVDEIRKILQSTAEEDHTDADCLIVTAMSHGESGTLFSYKNQYPVEMLWTPFAGAQCPTLAGKPKLFFIQACRGKLLDDGVKMFDETDGVGQFTYSLPTYADIFVAYSTYNGYYSWRNPDAGSWFIQAICEEFGINGHKHDLLTLMTSVHRRVAIFYESFTPRRKEFDKKKQIPSFVSMLTRLVYFPERSASASCEIDIGSLEIKNQ